MLELPAVQGENMYLTNLIHQASDANLLHRKFHRELNRFFYGGDAFGQSFPAIRQNKDSENFYLEIDLPGVSKEDLSLSLTNDVLTISGKTDQSGASEAENVNWLRRERPIGDFSRNIELPGEVQGDKIEATLKNGVLYLQLPIREEKKPRQIEIKAK